MTAAKSLEYQITQHLMRRRELPQQYNPTRLVDRVIAVAAVTAGLILLGSYLPGLLWVALAAGTVLVLGIGD